MLHMFNCFYIFLVDDKIIWNLHHYQGDISVCHYGAFDIFCCCLGILGRVQLSWQPMNISSQGLQFFYAIVRKILGLVLLSGQHKDECQCRNFVVFCYYWEYFGIYAIVQAINEDVDTSILFCFLPLSGEFQNLCHDRSLLFQLLLGVYGICTIIWVTRRCAAIRAFVFVIIRNIRIYAVSGTFCFPPLLGVSRYLCLCRANI